MVRPSRADLAKEWLRQQEAAEDWRVRLTLDAAVVAAAVGVIGLLVMLGITAFVPGAAWRPYMANSEAWSRQVAGFFMRSAPKLTAR